METEPTDDRTEGPPLAAASAEAASLATEEVTQWVRAVQEVGLLEELAPDDVTGTLGRSPLADVDALLLDLIGRYYGAEGDAEASGRRINRDRYFSYRDGERANAHMVLQRLAALVPEVGVVSLERIGSDDGPLVIRAGELLSAVTDHDTDIAAGEVDLSEIEEHPRVAVQSLVAAMNVLLERNGVPERMVQLPADGKREAYVALGQDAAVDLCERGLLEIDAPDLLRELAGW